MNTYICLLASVFGIFHQIQPAVKPYYTEKMLNFIFTRLPKHGILRKDEQGMVYVNIDNNYIYKLLEFIKQEKFQAPPYFGEGMHGAHITVMNPEEVLYYAIGDIKECGHVIKFEPKDCKIVHPETWAKGEQAYLITVEAPILHQLREKYGLPKNKYDFHITIGVKPKN
jgi:hypothetical protein